MDILIADKFQKSGIGRLESEGCRVIFSPDLTTDDLPDAVAEHDPHVLVVRSTKVPAPVFERAKRLKLVVRAGAGYDTIDVNAASAHGIYVSNCPGKNSIAVAELTWGLILACDRRIPDQVADLRGGTWNKKEYSKAQGLYGQTLGIIGLGRIGQEVAKRAECFGMPTIAWSRWLTREAAMNESVLYAESPIEVARRADVVTLHVAAVPDTKHLVNKEFCDALRPGATLINTTRGSVVDERALLEAVRGKGIRVGMDVYDNEPGAGDSTADIEIAREPGVYGTHHVGASTDQAQEAIAVEAVRIILQLKQTGTPPNVVNRQVKTAATRLLSVRHRNRPGVLAHIVGEIGKANINIEEVENVIYQGAEAACAKIQLAAEPSAETIQAINSSSSHVLSVDLTVIE